MQVSFFFVLLRVLFAVHTHAYPATDTSFKYVPVPVDVEAINALSEVDAPQGHENEAPRNTRGLFGGYYPIGYGYGGLGGYGLGGGYSNYYSSYYSQGFGGYGGYGGYGGGFGGPFGFYG